MSDEQPYSDYDPDRESPQDRFARLAAEELEAQRDERENPLSPGIFVERLRTFLKIRVEPSTANTYKYIPADSVLSVRSQVRGDGVRVTKVNYLEGHGGLPHILSTVASPEEILAAISGARGCQIVNVGAIEISTGDMCKPVYEVAMLPPELPGLPLSDPATRGGSRSDGPLLRPQEAVDGPARPEVGPEGSEGESRRPADDWIF